jgi:hypothetical protein
MGFIIAAQFNGGKAIKKNLSTLGWGVSSRKQEEMDMKLAAVLVLAPFAFAQTQGVDKTLYFAHTSPNLPEVATAIRTISNVPHLVADEAQKAIALGGSAEQMALAEWLFKAFDAPPAGQGDPNLVPPYRVSGTDDVVRMFYLPYTDTTQQLRRMLRRRP